MNVILFAGGRTRRPLSSSGCNTHGRSEAQFQVSCGCYIESAEAVDDLRRKWRSCRSHLGPFQVRPAYLVLACEADGVRLALGTLRPRHKRVVSR